MERLKGRNRERGFTLTELAVATLVLIFGLVAVAQLVPSSMRLNAGNRRDSTALAFAQRELNQMLGEPLTASSFLDAQGYPCSLGDAGSPNQVVGSPVAVVNDQPMINFAVSRVPGYNLSYKDPNDPSGTTYDVRWAVITMVNSAGSVASKRFILGVRQQDGAAVFQPVNLDSVVAR